MHIATLVFVASASARTSGLVTLTCKLTNPTGMTEVAWITGISPQCSELPPLLGPPSLTLGGAATTITSNDNLVTYFSATVPGPSPQPTPMSPNGFTSSSPLTLGPKNSQTVTYRREYYTTLAGLTITLGQSVPTSIFAPVDSACPQNFVLGISACIYCANGYLGRESFECLPIDSDDVPTVTSPSDSSTSAGGGQAAITAGGAVTTITDTAIGLTLTEYSAVLPLPQYWYARTITGSPSRTITFGDNLFFLTQYYSTLVPYFGEVAFSSVADSPASLVSSSVSSTLTSTLAGPASATSGTQASSTMSLASTTSASASVSALKGGVGRADLDVLCLSLVGVGAVAVLVAL